MTEARRKAQGMVAVLGYDLDSFFDDDVPSATVEELKECREILMEEAPPDKPFPKWIEERSRVGVIAIDEELAKRAKV